MKRQDHLGKNLILPLLWLVMVASLCGSDINPVRLTYDANDPRKVIDLYLPTETGPPDTSLPFVVYIHGGGWSGGSRKNLLDWRKRPVLDALLDHGVAVAAVEYRLADEAVRIRDQVVDIRQAVQRLCGIAGSQRLDPKRFLLWGDSAGGHLVLLSVAPLAGDLPELEPKALVLWYPATDLADVVTFNDTFRIKRIRTFGRDPETEPAWYAAFSPLTYAASYRIPITIFHGSADPIISHEQVSQFARMVNASGGQVDLRTVEQGIHGFQKEPGPASIEPGLAAIQKATAKVIRDYLDGR